MAQVDFYFNEAFILFEFLLKSLKAFLSFHFLFGELFLELRDLAFGLGYYDVQLLLQIGYSQLVGVFLLHEHLLNLS